MRLHVPQLQDLQVVAISGSEPWLKPFYEVFSDHRDDSAGVQGELKLKRSIDRETVEITGELRYTAPCRCDLCGANLSFDLCAPVAVSYRRIPEAVKSKKVHVLQAEELDEYYYESDFCVDLLQVIIDSVQCELPEHPRCSENCSESLPDEEPKISNQSLRPNPFASLANLKLDDGP